MDFSAAERARRIRLVLFDVDGVLTDGKIWTLPVKEGEKTFEPKGFHAHDGTGISLARLAGIKTGLITKRISETVALRARDLKMDHVHQGIQDKAGVMREILEKDGITAAEVAFVGDDVIDLPAMRKCGLAIAVKNARPEVKTSAMAVTDVPGGQGAVREVVELLIKAQGHWDGLLKKYEVSI